MTAPTPRKRQMTQHPRSACPGLNAPILRPQIHPTRSVHNLAPRRTDLSRVHPATMLRASQRRRQLRSPRPRHGPASTPADSGPVSPPEALAVSSRAMPMRYSISACSIRPPRIRSCHAGVHPQAPAVDPWPVDHDRESEVAGSVPRVPVVSAAPPRDADRRRAGPGAAAQIDRRERLVQQGGLAASRANEVLWVARDQQSNAAPTVEAARPLKAVFKASPVRAGRKGLSPQDGLAANLGDARGQRAARAVRARIGWRHRH